MLNTLIKDLKEAKVQLKKSFIEEKWGNMFDIENLKVTTETSFNGTEWLAGYAQNEKLPLPFRYFVDYLIRSQTLDLLFSHGMDETKEYLSQPANIAIHFDEFLESVNFVHTHLELTGWKSSYALNVLSAQLGCIRDVDIMAWGIVGNSVHEKIKEQSTLAETMERMAKDPLVQDDLSELAGNVVQFKPKH